MEIIQHENLIELLEKKRASLKRKLELQPKDEYENGWLMGELYITSLILDKIYEGEID